MKTLILKLTVIVFLVLLPLHAKPGNKKGKAGGSKAGAAKKGANLKAQGKNNRKKLSPEARKATKRKIFADIDKDKDKRVNLEEFLAHSPKNRKNVAEGGKSLEEIKAHKKMIFQKMDTNGNGFIEDEEFEQFEFDHGGKKIKGKNAEAEADVIPGLTL